VNALEGELSEIGRWRRRLQETDLGVAAVGLEESRKAIVVTSRQYQAPALDILLHDFKELADLVVSLFLAVADIGEGEKRLSTAETATKLAQGSKVGNREGARCMEGAGETLDTKDDVDNDGVDV
jgi:hypothetical protein